MSANRKGPYRPIIPRWSQNAGRLMEGHFKGRCIWVVCSRCKTNDLVDVFAICEKYGPLWSPWNRRPLCKTCGDPRFFTGHHNQSDFVRPLFTEEPHRTDDLHEIYWALRGKV